MRIILLIDSVIINKISVAVVLVGVCTLIEALSLHRLCCAAGECVIVVGGGGVIYGIPA